MTLRKNAMANYLGQAYISCIGIIVLPFYLKYLGAAAFGLVGFFTVLQSWLRLLDLGLTPALARQVAFTRGGSQNYWQLRQLVRSMEMIFLCLSLLIFFGIYFASHWIASQWFNAAQGLSIATIEYCIVLMGITFAFRWLNDLYGGGLIGFEKQVTYNVIMAIGVSLRFIGGWCFLHYVSTHVSAFFEYQVWVALFNLLMMQVAFYWVMPKTRMIGLKISIAQLKNIAPLALGLSYSSLVWILVTQSDKLVFSHLLPLSQYGYFSLLVIITSGIQQITSPLSQAILPKMTYLLSQNKKEQMLNLYCQASNYMAVIMFPIVGCIAIFAHPLLYAWSGSMAAAHWGAKILFWYALASGVLAMVAFQYYLQYAHGRLKLHIWYNTAAAFIQVPITIWIAYDYGVYAIALLWFLFNLASLVLWVPVVHYCYARAINRRWFQNIGIIALLALMGMMLIQWIPVSFNAHRLLDFVKMLSIGFGCLTYLFIVVYGLMRWKRIIY